jgi:dienelactone hydrolase
MQDTLQRTRLHTGAAYGFRAADSYDQHTGKMPAVLLVPGWTSNVFGSTYEALAKRLRAIGYHTMQLSLQGHEGSQRDISTASRLDHMQDILAAFSYLSNRPEVDMQKLGVVGASYGAYMLSCFLPMVPGVQLVALRAPALYRDEGWNEPVVQAVRTPDRLEWRRTVRTPTESKALKGIAEYHGDFLLVSSENDEDMPKEVMESYLLAATAVRSKLHVDLVGASHSLSEEHLEKFLDVTTRWFKERYPAKNTAPAA